MFIEMELGDNYTARLPSPFLQVDAWGHFNLRLVNFVIGFKRGKRVAPVYTLPLPRGSGGHAHQVRIRLFCYANINIGSTHII